MLGAALEEIEDWEELVADLAAWSTRRFFFFFFFVDGSTGVAETPEETVEEGEGHGEGGGWLAAAE